MQTRSTRSTMTFANDFTLPGYPGVLPKGEYQVLVDEELIQGLSFDAYRRTATYLMVPGSGVNAGRSELRSTTAADLDAALERDQAATAQTVMPALSTQECGQ